MLPVHRGRGGRAATPFRLPDREAAGWQALPRAEGLRGGRRGEGGAEGSRGGRRGEGGGEGLSGGQGRGAEAGRRGEGVRGGSSLGLHRCSRPAAEFGSPLGFVYPAPPRDQVPNPSSSVAFIGDAFDGALV